MSNLSVPNSCRDEQAIGPLAGDIRSESRSASKLRVGLGDFAAALFDPARPVPPGLVGPDGKLSTRRFDVYRNNVMASLTRVLRSAFPATARIVGEDFFVGMACVHVAEKPPKSPMLFDYGVDFPDFIQRFEPAAGLAYLPDIARIEWAWIEAYHAPEARSIGPADFAQIDPDDLPNLRVALHPSLHIVRSLFPAFTIWRTNINDDVPQSVNLAVGAEDALIVRPDAEVEVRALLPGGADFLLALRDGSSMLNATKAAIAADRRFDLSANLSELIGANLFIDLVHT